MSLLDRCNPRLITVDASCGCTLTRADIVAMTPASFEALGFLEVESHRIIGQEKELRRTGVPERALKDLLLSRSIKLPMTNIGGNKSIIAPFRLVPQRHIINSNYWEIVTGGANSGAGVGGVHPGAWDLTIRNHRGDFHSPLVDLEKYFLPGKFIIVLTADVGTGVGRSLQFKVLSAVNADAGGVERAKVTVEPNYSAAGFAQLDPADQAIYQPARGLVLNLSNSVSDYESWCNQYPAENTLKLRDFWDQTIRSTWCYNDEYVKALNADLASQYYKKFATLPIAEQRRRQGAQEDRDFYNTVYWGQRINENQTADGYTALPQVVDPLNEECLLEYKANTLGIHTQLDECGRVVDAQGAALDMDTLRSMLYNVKRTRENEGAQIESLDAFTDRLTFASIRQVMIAYYKDRYGMDATRFYNPGQAIKFQNQVLWKYDTYEFPEDGFVLNVFRDEMFDDMLAATPTAIKARGRQFWVIDWSDIDIGISAVKSVTRQTNVADDVYNCIIQPNVNHYQLQSKRLCVMVEDPNRHVIMENFSDLCPEITADACSNS